MAENSRLENATPTKTQPFDSHKDSPTVLSMALDTDIVQFAAVPPDLTNTNRPELMQMPFH